MTNKVHFEYYILLCVFELCFCCIHHHCNSTGNFDSVISCVFAHHRLTVHRKGFFLPSRFFFFFFFIAKQNIHEEKDREKSPHHANAKDRKGVGNHQSTYFLSVVDEPSLIALTRSTTIGHLPFFQSPFPFSILLVFLFQSQPCWRNVPFPRLLARYDDDRLDDRVDEDVDDDENANQI